MCTSLQHISLHARMHRQMHVYVQHHHLFLHAPLQRSMDACQQKPVLADVWAAWFILSTPLTAIKLSCDTGKPSLCICSLQWSFQPGSKNKSAPSRCRMALFAGGFFDRCVLGGHTWLARAGTTLNHLVLLRVSLDSCFGLTLAISALQHLEVMLCYQPLIAIPHA